MNLSDSEIRKFWEWCGFKYQNFNSPAFPHQGGQWVDDDNQPVFDNDGELPPIDLNNLFKFAVPKLYKMGWSYELKGYTYHAVDLYNNKYRVSSKGLKDPASALFRAIQEVIKGKE